MGEHTLMIVAMVLAVCAVATTEAKNPWFCQSYDCPAYTSTDMGAYELRNYAQSTWVVTSVTSSSPNPNRSETREMFGKLFKYIKENKIKMTVPVLTKTEKLGSGYKVSMMFYLTSSTSPAPTDTSVFLVTRPAGIVYVRSFPSRWRPSNYAYTKELGEMKKAVADPSLYVDNSYYKAGYNSPWDFFMMKQFEVWMDSMPRQ